MPSNYTFLTQADIISIVEGVVDNFLVPRFMELNMNASGEWIKSLEIVVPSSNEAIIRGRDYTYFLTRGRGKNQNQDPKALRRWAVWAGKTFIGDWVRDKGIAADPIAVAMSIAKKGTTWKRKGGSNLLEVLEEPETIKYIAERVRQVVTPRVAEELRRNAIEAFRNF